MRLLSQVARREVRERLRSRSFQVSTFIAVAITIGAIVLPSLGSGALRPVVRVGTVESDQSRIRGQLDAFAIDLGADLEFREFVDENSAGEGLKDEDVHLVVVREAKILLKEPVPEADESAKVRVARLLSAAHAVTRQPLPIDSVLPTPERERGDAAIALFGTVMIYAFVFVYGSTILSGVAEEKGSRVIEVLLSVVPARSLLHGKVIGIGMVALAQGGLVVLTAFASYAAIGRSPLEGARGGEILQVFGWFILAYAFYAWAYAAAGATVSRQEEAQSLQFPLGLPILIAYIAAATSLGGEDSRLLRVLSYLPPTAPVAMPMRSAMGFVSPATVLLVVAGTIGATLLVIRLAGVIYERSILRMGARVRLRKILLQR